jgi:hypothetical protein
MDLSHVYDPDADDRNKSELDSHADTCVAGANAVPLWYTDAKVSTSTFIGEYMPLENIPIATVATAWDSPMDGSTIILVINEALYFGDRMDHSLLCPNQLRDFGLIVNDVLKRYDADSSHSIIIPGQIELPLKMQGVISYLETRKPTDEELLNCPRYELTASAPWDPYEADGDSSWRHQRFDREAESLRAHMTTTDLIYPLELHDSIPSRLVCAIKSLPGIPVNAKHPEADVIAHFDDFIREASTKT